MSARDAVPQRAAGLVRALKAENAKLRRALRPFAKEADEWSDGVPDNYRPGVTEPGMQTFCSRARFTVGSLRRARAAIAEIKETPDAE